MPLCRLLLQPSQVGVLAQELALQGIRTRERLRRAKDVLGVLLGGVELVLDALLIQTSVTRKVGLLRVDLVLDLLLGKLGRLVVVLEQQIAIGVADVMRQRVLGVLNLLVVGRATECTALSELRG